MPQLIDRAGQKVPGDEEAEGRGRKPFLKKAGLVSLAVADPFVLPVGQRGEAQESRAMTAEMAQTGGTDRASAITPGEIPRRPLGRTGVEVSALALGGYHVGSAKSEHGAIRIV
jgi:hypothetical protein